MRISSTVSAFLFCSGFARASAKVLQLTEDNIDKMVEGKTVFIKFFAPWCGHCKAMAEDWEKLAAEWEGHEIGLVAEVDCTDEKGKSVCEDFDIQGFPTLMYGDPHSPEAYEGGRDFESLSEFAKENISKPVCSVKNMKFCSDDQKKVIEDLQKKSKEDLLALEAEVEKELGGAQDKYEAGLEDLNDQYEAIVKEFNEKVEEIREKSNYKWVQQVLLSKEEAESPDGNDEL